MKSDIGPTDEREIDLYRLRLVIKGALDYFLLDNDEIVGILQDQNKHKLADMLTTTEAALRWLRRMVEDALAVRDGDV